MKYFKLKFLLIFAALAMAIPPAWAANAVIEFKANGSDVTTAIPSTNMDKLGEQVTNGFDYIQSFTSQFIYPGADGLKIGKSSGDPYLSITLAALNNGSWKSTKIIIRAKKFGSDASKFTLSANSKYFPATTLNADFQNYEFDLDDNTTLSTIKIEGTKRLYLKSITIVHEGPEEPIITVDPPTGLTINDATGDDKTGTLTATLTNGQGDLTAATNPSDKWSWNNNTVTFNGKELGAEGTVTFSSTGANDVVANLEYNYTGPLYILGTVNGWTSWGANNAVEIAEPDANGIYTVTLTTAAGEQGMSWISFSKRVAENNDDGGWAYIAPYRFSLQGENVNTAYWLTEDKINTWIDLDFDPDHAGNQPLRMDPGQYIITIDAKNNKFKIQKVAGPKIYNKVTHESQLIAGKKYILVYEDTPAFLGGISTTDTNYGIPVTGPTLEDNSVNIGQYSDIRELTLSGSSGEWLFHNGDGYLTWSGGNSLTVVSTPTTGSNQSKWTVSSSDNSYVLKSAVNNARVLQYNPSSPRFACYTSTMKPVVLYVEDGVEPVLPSVDNPTILPEDREFASSVEVSMTCATDGASIYYTLDGTDPTTSSVAYTAPFTLNATTTVKAIAALGNETSQVVTATFTKTGIETIADAQALPTSGANANFTFVGSAVVTFHNGNHLYIRDGSGSGLIYGVDAATKKYNNGDVLTAGWKAKNDVYQVHTPEFTDPSNVGSTVNNGAVEPLPLTTIELGDVNKYAKIDNVTITSNNGQNYYYKVGDNEYCLRCAYTDLVSKLTVNKRYNVTGVVTIYRSGSAGNYSYTPQLNLISAELIKEDLTLSFDPASVELYVGETFTAPALKGVPEGATIDVTYSSSNTEVATVTDNVVSLVEGATGTATITATFAGNDEYNEASATYTITVKAKEAAGLSYGEEPVTVAATYGDTEFTEPELTNAAGLAVTYSTSNDKVATVDENGNVTIVGAGTAVITATTEGDASHAGGSASYTINVAKADAKVTFSEHEYTVYVNGAFTEPTLTTDPEGLEVTYSIKGNENETVLFEDGTVVIGDVPGTVTITATFAGNDNYNEASDSYTITVKAKEVATLSFDVEGITVYPKAEDFTQPKLTTAPENLTVTYTSTDDDIATVVDGVLMIGDKTGTATITATFAGNDTYGTATASYTVTVEPRPIVAADEGVEFELYVGQTEAKTFDVMGENLKGDISLTLNDETGFYSIEPTTIDMAHAENATVTVTYAPTTEGIHEATVTLSTKDAEENVTVTLTGMAEVQPVVAMPTFSLVGGSYTGVQTVTISCATDGATISYSTDGGQTWTVGNTVNVDKDMTIMAKASKDGYTISETATAAYIIDIPEELPTITPFKGYYQIKNNGNGMYANIAGRKTLNFTDAPADKAGTVIYVETNDKGQVQSLRSQAADLQGYANRAMRYVPKMVEIVVNKINEMEGIEDATGAGSVLGENGLEEIMAKFNECFDYHLYVEQAGEGWRLYGKTPNMQHVVDFYREHKSQVEAKLPKLEQFINDALDKLINKIGGSSVFTDFSLHQIWEKMGGTLTEPTDDASTMAFYREVLNNKNYVWDFAYQTAMIYVNNVKNHPRWSEVEAELGEYAQYIDKIDQIRPDFKYYVVADGNKPDFISEGNKDIINNAARTIWTMEERSTFTVNIPANAETTCDKFQKATTLYTDFAYELPEGVTAYKVTDVVEGTAITEALSGVIPAQTPVLLMAAEAGDKVLTLSTEAGTAVTGNLLVGPDYLINTYKLTTPQVEGIFNMIKEKLGEDFYNTYVKEYEHLMYLNSGTVNNKYFWGLKEEDVKKCTYLDEEGVKDYVVRGLEGNAFVNNKQVKTNKAFLVSEDAQIINLNKRGDVNHDGKVNIKDVTDLIDRLLDPENTVACPICSDFNLSGKVDIKDVTDLIDVLLTAPYAEQEEPSTGSQD